MDSQCISDLASNGGDHAFDEPFGAAEPTGLLGTGLLGFTKASPLQRPDGYICLHPGCDDFIRGNEVHLDEHVKTHFIDAIKSPLQLMPDQFSGLAQSEDNTDRLSDNSHGFVTINSTNSPSVATESTPIEFQQWTPASDPKTSRPRFTPSDRRFPCSYCPSSFHRNSDCVRHMKIHDETPGVRYDCLVAECPRNGLKGFWRSDKLREHVAARHPFSDFNRYLKSRNGWQLSLFSIRRFVLWQREKHLWQTEHPSAEIPPLLRIGIICWHNFNCPDCEWTHIERPKYYFRYDLENHMRTQHPLVHVPFWLQNEFLYRDADMDEKEMLEKLNLRSSLSAYESGFIDEEPQA